LSKSSPTKEDLLKSARKWSAEHVGERPSRRQFFEYSGFNDGDIARHFAKWSEFLAEVGDLPAYRYTKKTEDGLLEDWGRIVREKVKVPTLIEYKLWGGEHSPSVFKKYFGGWTEVPDRFREFAEGKPEWADVLATLRTSPAPTAINTVEPKSPQNDAANFVPAGSRAQAHTKLGGRPTYGNPIGFRGLRHEPINEQGVVFLFGMVAKELGYMVEAVQTGFPDCEAIRRIDKGRWERVKIEFEFESRNAASHSQLQSGCDLIVCWRNNWPECPVEVVELSKEITNLKFDG